MPKDRGASERTFIWRRQFQTNNNLQICCLKVVLISFPNINDAVVNQETTNNDLVYDILTQIVVASYNI